MPGMSRWHRGLLAVMAAWLAGCGGPVSHGSGYGTPVRSAAAAAASASPAPPHALFRRTPHLCPLISPALLRRYLPGVRLHGTGETAGRTGEPIECGWDTRGGGYLTLMVTRLNTMAAARQDFGSDLALGPSHPGWTTYRVAGVGDQAVGYTSNDSPGPYDNVMLFARYANLEFSLDLTLWPPVPDPAGQLAALIAFARDFTANLAGKDRPRFTPTPSTATPPPPGAAPGSRAGQRTAQPRNRLGKQAR